MVDESRKPRGNKNRIRAIAIHTIKNENSVLIAVLIALSAGMAIITKGLTARRSNIINILLQSSIVGVASIGQAFVILSAGIDLSIGGLGMASAALGAGLMTGNIEQNLLSSHPLSPYIAIPIMLLFGSAFGAFNGGATSRIGMPSLIVTLATWQLTKGISFAITHGMSLYNLPLFVTSFGVGKIAGVPYAVIIFVVVCVIGYLVLEHTSFGRGVYATGGNPTSAWLSGINVKNTQLAVFCISGFLAGLAGFMAIARMAAASMKTLVGLELDTIAAVCVGGVSLMGGKGTIIGVIIGVLIISTANNGMSVRGCAPAELAIVKGAIIFSAVAVDYIRRR